MKSYALCYRSRLRHKKSAPRGRRVAMKRNYRGTHSDQDSEDGDQLRLAGLTTRPCLMALAVTRT